MSTRKHKKNRILSARSVCPIPRLRVRAAIFVFAAGIPTHAAVADSLADAGASAGARVDSVTGSIAVAGRAIIGNASAGRVACRAGAVPVLRLVFGVRSSPPVRSGPMADFDADGDMDVADLLIFYQGFSGPGQRTPIPETDLDGDGDTDLADLIIFQTAFTGSQ